MSTVPSNWVIAGTLYWPRNPHRRSHWFKERAPPKEDWLQIDGCTVLYSGSKESCAAIDSGTDELSQQDDDDFEEEDYEEQESVVPQPPPILMKTVKTPPNLQKSKKSNASKRVAESPKFHISKRSNVGGAAASLGECLQNSSHNNSDNDVSPYRGTNIN